MEYVVCPNCQSKSWYDRAALGDSKHTMRFKCTRCGDCSRVVGMYLDHDEV